MLYFCIVERETLIKLKCKRVYCSNISSTLKTYTCIHTRFYVKALELYPQHSSIHLKYAGFLRHSRRDVSGAEKHYLRAVETSPSNSDALGSYASFMHGVHNNLKEAEKYYKKAVEADFTHTNNLCNYGLFLRLVQLCVIRKTDFKF